MQSAPEILALECTFPLLIVTNVPVPRFILIPSVPPWSVYGKLIGIGPNLLLGRFLRRARDVLE